MSPIPLRNDRMVDGLRNEYVTLYSPTTTWGNIISINLGLPVLRGYWSFTSIDENDDVYDLSGQGRVMSNAIGP